MNPIKKHIAISVNNLTIGFSKKKTDISVAENLNFEIPKGNFICLLGKNGVGKSTLLRTLSKVQPILSGKVLLKNRNLNSINNQEISKKLSLVLSEKLPESNLTVKEFISLGRQPYTNWLGSLAEKDKEIIDKSILLTNVEKLVDKKYFELSDGQFQRVLISRALAQDTDIIILDEPTNHLDIEHTLETFDLLEKLAKEQGKTIIISTHHIQLALQFAHKIFLMTDNDFITGTPQELIQNKSMDQLFNNPSISFDAIKQQYILLK